MARGHEVTQRRAGVCARRASGEKTADRVVPRAGMGKTVASTVTAVTVVCVNWSLEAVPVD